MKMKNGVWQVGKGRGSNEREREREGRLVAFGL